MPIRFGDSKFKGFFGEDLKELDKGFLGAKLKLVILGVLLEPYLEEGCLSET